MNIMFHTTSIQRRRQSVSFSSTLLMVVLFLSPYFTLLSSSSLFTKSIRTRRAEGIVILVASAIQRSTFQNLRSQNRRCMNQRNNNKKTVLQQQEDKVDEDIMNVKFHPTCLSIHQLSHSYPSTLWRTLFSSVPEREYALYNITLQSPAASYEETSPPSSTAAAAAESSLGEMILLVGASSSGKSALLKQIAGLEESSSSPSSLDDEEKHKPKISITSPCLGKEPPSATYKQQRHAKDIFFTTTATNNKKHKDRPYSGIHPIILDQKPPFDNSRCVQDVLNDLYSQIEKQIVKQKTTTSTAATMDGRATTTAPSATATTVTDTPSLTSLQSLQPRQIQNAIINATSQLVGLTETNLVQQTPSELSPSENYRFGLVIATLQSILPTILSTYSTATTSSAATATATAQQEQPKLLREEGPASSAGTESHHYCLHLPSPLLLLDEWMDFETSTVIQRVEESLIQLCNHGAIILCATHKPHFYAKQKSYHRTITLCRGEILSDTSSSSYSSTNYSP